MANGEKRKKIISNHSLISQKFSSSLVVSVSAVSCAKPCDSRVTEAQISFEHVCEC